MRAVLKALLDGRTCDVGDRPLHATIRTMLALRSRGMVTHEQGRWLITPLGKERADD